MLNKLKYRFQRQRVNDSAIEDVYDGKIYQESSKAGAFLSYDSNISLLGNTDGVSLIRSTGYGVWPLYLVINELPPLER